MSSLATPRVKFVQRRVVVRRAQQRVSSQQHARAHAAHDVELWPSAALAPADEEAGTQGAALTTARERQYIRCMSALAFNYCVTFSPGFDIASA